MPAAELNQLVARGLNFHADQLGGAAITPDLQAIVAAIDPHPASTAAAIPVSNINDRTSDISRLLNIQSVTINGQPVDALDAAGHFFSTQTLTSGANSFAITALDANGHATSTTLALLGVDPGSVVNFNRLQNVTPLAELTYHATTYNRSTHTLHASVTLTFSQQMSGSPRPGTPGRGAGGEGQSLTGLPSLSPVVLAVFDAITPAAVALTSADGIVPASTGSAHADRPYQTFDTELPATGLLPGATSTPLALSFANPQSLRFSVATTLHAEANAAPLFTTAPTTQTNAGASYVYAAQAVDPDADSLTYTLTVAPAGMTLVADLSNPAISNLVWSPTALDIGNHTLELTARDDHGGTATQQWTLTVFAAATNLPPVILSRPPKFATFAEPFTSDVAARDPEGAPVAYSLTTAPAGAQIDRDTGVLTWLPSLTLPSSPFTLSATDPQGHFAEQTFSLRVRDTNTAPTITSTPRTSVTAGVAHWDRITATDTEDAVT